MKRLSALFWSLLFLAVPVLGVATFAVAPAYDIWLPKDVSEQVALLAAMFSWMGKKFLVYHQKRCVRRSEEHTSELQSR